MEWPLYDCCTTNPPFHEFHEFQENKESTTCVFSRPPHACALTRGADNKSLILKGYRGAGNISHDSCTTETFNPAALLSMVVYYSLCDCDFVNA